MKIEATVGMGGKEGMDGFLEEVTSAVRISRAGTGAPGRAQGPCAPLGAAD